MPDLREGTEVDVFTASVSLVYRASHQVVGQNEEEEIRDCGNIISETNNNNLFGPTTQKNGQAKSKELTEATKDWMARLDGEASDNTRIEWISIAQSGALELAR